MGADLVRFKIRFDEHVPSGRWDERKYEIANFIANCWHGYDKDISYKNVCKILKSEAAEDSVVTYKDYEWDDSYSYFELEDPEFYGLMGKSMSAMNAGMQEFFPDIDYEFHYYEWYGDIYDSVDIVIGGKSYGGRYFFHTLSEYLEEEDYDEDDDECEEKPLKTIDNVLALPEFQIPEATEDNPYPIPESILDDEFSFPPEMEWFVPKFK